MAFDHIKEDTQMKIINAALKEFAEKGYKLASTNQIVKRAGVGKGMLYYYFKNKQELFEFLIKNSLDAIEYDYIEQFDLNETDFFKRFSQIVELKMKVHLQNEYLFNFMSEVFVMEDAHLPNDQKERINTLRTEGFAKLYQNVDYSRFRQDLDVEKSIQLIQWSMDGYANTLIDRLKGIDFSKFDYKHYHEEFLEYLEVLKKAYYK